MKSKCMVRLWMCMVPLWMLCDAHNDEAPPSTCDRNIGTSHVQAAFLGGTITVDGDSSDWALVPSHRFSLLQAIDPHLQDPYPFGTLSLKVAHDGSDIFFLIEVPGPFEYVQGEEYKCPSMALMFGVGDNATYFNMGGCHEGKDTCSMLSCKGHEVDIVHFSIHNAIPGRLYGQNIFDNLNSTGRDSFGNLNDLYGWNPHCRQLDGLLPNGTAIKFSGSQNDWRGVWSHTSIDISDGLVESDSPFSSPGTPGMYIFELARPLRTIDRLQQDVQFTIGRTYRFITAFWYPVKNVPWDKSQHYSASCDWLTLDIMPASILGGAKASSKSVNAVSLLSLFFSFTAMVISVVLVWWVRKGRNLQFVSIDGL